jgi:osmotically-inducible protein OsmY
LEAEVTYDYDRIREAINNRLIEDPDLDASDIEVEVDRDAVILSGSVDSRWDKLQAEDIAYSVSGVREVINKLRVSMSTQTTPIQTGTTGTMRTRGMRNRI